MNELKNKKRDVVCVTYFENNSMEPVEFEIKRTEFKDGFGSPISDLISKENKVVYLVAVEFDGSSDEICISSSCETPIHFLNEFCDTVNLANIHIHEYSNFKDAYLVASDMRETDDLYCDDETYKKN